MEVKNFMTVEKYSKVTHLVSDVQGKLRKDKTPMDALFSVLPAGTLSGAPKVRAMEIIDELEEKNEGSMEEPLVIWRLTEESIPVSPFEPWFLKMEKDTYRREPELWQILCRRESMKKPETKHRQS